MPPISIDADREEVATVGLYAHLGQVWDSTRAEALPVTLVLVALDHFSALRALEGDAHAAGVLEASEAVLESMSRRPLDATFPLGGGDFMVVWPDTSDDTAAQLTRHIVKLIRLQGLTASMGVAVSWPHRGETIGSALTRAEAALRQAQAAGCNRTRWARAG